MTKKEKAAIKMLYNKYSLKKYYNRYNGALKDLIKCMEECGYSIKPFELDTRVCFYLQHSSKNAHEKILRLYTCYRTAKAEYTIVSNILLHLFRHKILAEEIK